MSIDTALQTINDNAIKAAGAQKLPIETQTPLVVLNGKLVDLEKFGANPTRHRSSYRTSNLAAFIAFAISAAADQSKEAGVFVNQDDMTAQAFFDLGDANAPAFSTDNANLGLKQTAEYTALLRIHERELSQKQAADFAIDWEPNTTFIGPDGEELSHAKVLAAFRSITVKVAAESHNEQRDTGRTQSQFEQAEAVSKEVLPAGVIFRAAPYLGLDERNINLRITVNTEGTKPTITFRIVGLEKLQESMGDELVEKLIDGLGNSASVTIGSLSAQ